MPTESRTGPDRFRVRADIDLGGEGVIVRRIGSGGHGGPPMGEVRGRSAEQPFRFYAQPALFGALEDGRYRIDAGWFTGDFDSTPFTQLILNGVRDVDDAVVVSGWIGIPQATAPAFGEPLPADRVIRWTADGAEPGLHLLSMSGGDGNPAWRHFAPGNVREAPIPDLSSIPEIEDIAPGFVTWSVYAVQIPGFDFNTFSYSHLNSRLWSGVAADTFTASR
jgi:hypothetical protein